jgi:hypothetical protein
MSNREDKELAQYSQGFEDMIAATKLKKEFTFPPVEGSASRYMVKRGEEVIGHVTDEWMERFRVAFDDSGFRVEVAANERYNGAPLRFTDLMDIVGEYFEKKQDK